MSLHLHKPNFEIHVKVGYQSCVDANSMHTEWELCTPMGVGVANRQLQLEAVLTAE